MHHENTTRAKKTLTCSAQRNIIACTLVQPPRPDLLPPLPGHIFSVSYSYELRHECVAYIYEVVFNTVEKNRKKYVLRSTVYVWSDALKQRKMKNKTTKSLSSSQVASCKPNHSEKSEGKHSEITTKPTTNHTHNKYVSKTRKTGSNKENQRYQVRVYRLFPFKTTYARVLTPKLKKSTSTVSSTDRQIDRYSTLQPA